MFTVEIPMQVGQKLLPSIVTQSAIHPYTSGAVTRIDRCSTRSCRHQYASIHKVPFTAYSIWEYVSLQWTESSRSTDSHVIGATCHGQTDQCAKRMVCCRHRKSTHHPYLKQWLSSWVFPKNCKRVECSATPIVVYLHTVESTHVCSTCNNSPGYSSGWLGSRVVSMLDSGIVRPGFKSQLRHCRLTVLGKLFTPIVPVFTKQRSW